MNAKRPSKSKKRAKKSWRLRLFRWVRRLLFAVAAIIAVPLILIPAYAYIPPVSTLMLYDLVTFKGYQRQWVAYDDLPNHAIYSVLMSEDARHCEHKGVDWEEFERVLKEYLNGGRARGASTVTMQTVKNLFLWHGRSPVRKVIELPLALYADLVWSKRRTLEIYLNIVEWDAHIYGIEAASRHYFSRPAMRLTRRQAALLAVTLPNPKARNPARPTKGLNRLARTIVERARTAGAYVGCLHAESAVKQ